MLGSNDQYKKALRVKSQQYQIADIMRRILISEDDKKLDEIIKFTLSNFKLEACVLLSKDETGFHIAAANRDVDNSLLNEMANNICDRRQVLLINDTSRHARLRNLRIKNIVGVPLFFSKKVIGAFFFINIKRGFTKKDLANLITISKFTTPVFYFSTLRDEIGIKNKELDMLYTVDRIRDTIKDVKTMLDAVLHEILKRINAEVALFVLYNRKTKKYELHTAGKHRQSSFVKENQKDLYAIANATISRGEVTVFNSVNQDVESALSAPFILSDEVMGAIQVINAKNGFTKQDAVLLKAATNQIDSAIFEDMAKSEIRNIFQRYVSPDVMKEMLESPEGDFLKVEKREVTVLFSDLRGFTSLSEKIPPEKVVELLNEHFEVMTEIILKFKGTLDKFVGDEIMAIFGAPIYYEANALRAVKAALAMQEAQKRLTKKWKKDLGVDVEVGIGINTGEVVVGNIGCRQMTDYTVIGDNVNIAARLCGAAGPGDILIAKNTYEEVKRSVRAFELEPMTLKGKKEKQPVFNVKGLR